MATVQGIVRYAGSPIGKCFYSAYFKSNSGGSAGPGNGQRASQWMRGAYLTEASGLFSVALSSDNFLGAGATVSAGDQVVVICWRKSSFTPPEAGGNFYGGMSGTDGKGGMHDVGFKYDNGDAASANYGDVDQFVAKVFTLTGQAWNATPGGVGGDANGDLVLNLNAGPTAAVTAASTNPASPTTVTRGVSFNILNASTDTVTGRDYVFNGQVIFEQSSGAHNPSGGTQAADGSATDGTRYEFFPGSTYGQPFGTPAGGDANGADFSTYAGPAFHDHAHTFPHIDTYRIHLTVKDDSGVPLTSSLDIYYRTIYRVPSITLLAREYCTWPQFASNPSDANVNWGAANRNTINDACRVRATLTDVDRTIGRIASGRFAAPVALNPVGTTVIAAPGIDVGLPASAPYGFFVAQTHSGIDVRYVYPIVAKAAGQITIDSTGSALSYATRDWWITTSTPAGGTDTHYSWEVNEGAGWQRVGRAPAPCMTALAGGTSVAVSNIGEGTLPGWSLRFIDGPARGSYRIASIVNDNELTLAVPMPAPNLGDSFEIGCYDATLFWSQRLNQQLDFRLVGSRSDGWTHEVAVGPVTQAGTVGNIAPAADLARAVIPGAATTYEFDGRRSLGTATTWVQEGFLASLHLVTGGAATLIADAALNTTGLRDGHAWILFFDADDIFTVAFPIADIDRESPDVTALVIDALGWVGALNPGARFRTTNSYEIEGANTDSDVASYAWELRTAAAAQVQPTSHAEFVARFDRADGVGSASQWSYTYAQVDDGRHACIELTVTDYKGASHTVWVMFDVTVTPAVPTQSVARRIEWE